MKNKIIVWDLDNTLYRETPEFHDLMDQITAEAAIEDLHLPLKIDEAKAMVTESYRTYRDGGEIFVRKYGVSPKKIFDAYHKRKEHHLMPIVPYEGLLDKLENLRSYKKNETADVYLKFCRTIGANPQDCLFVDDSYSNLECAKKAGLNTIRLCHGKPNDKASEYIDYAADNINECLDLLSNLCA